jgi:predicted RNase H-related nuclease YkuK (DUF458 family)
MTTMLNRKWRSINEKKIDDINAELTDILNGVKTVYVGTDSQQHGLYTEFVTVIVVHEKMKGARVFYTQEKVPRIKSLRERLLKEVWMSVQLAMEISPMLSEESELQVHCDINTNTKFKSSAYVKEVVSMVVSQGFECKLKPEAWAAGHAADHVVKHKVIAGN